MRHMYFLMVVLFVSVLGLDHHCLKFSIDTKSDYKFVTIQIGTPLTPYRFLTCTSPKISNMNFYQTILLGSSFGSSVSNTFSSRFKDRNSGLNLDPKYFEKPHDDTYYDSISSKIYSKMYSHRDETLNNIETFSKSVTFEEMYVDQWSTIGEDYSRSLDGTWFKIGLEISNLNSPQKFFDSYCNPGGIGDSVVPDTHTYDSSKYGQIDGIFLVGVPNTYLVSTYDFHSMGSSTVMIDNSMLKFCYQNFDLPLDLAIEMPHNSMISGKMSKYKNYEHNNMINLNAKGQDKIRYVESVMAAMTNNNIFLSKKGKNVHLQDVNVSKFFINVGDNHRIPKFLLDTHVLDIPYITDTDINYRLSINKKDFSDLNFGVLPPFFKKNIDNKVRMESYSKKLELSISENNKNKKRSENTKENDHVNGGYNIKILLSQPYNYLPQKIFKNYVSGKNFVTDVPDQTWENLCIESDDSSEKFCLRSSSIIKSDYLSSEKNGYIEYFPKSVSSYVSHLNIIRGGKILGNTIVDRSSRSIKVSGDFERIQSSLLSENHDDAYFRHALSNFVPTGGDILSDSKKFLSGIRQTNVNNKNDGNKRSILGNIKDLSNSMENLKSRMDFIKSNKLLILPHFSDESTVYIGTSTIFQNYGGFKIVTNHSTGSLHVFTAKTTGISSIFLPYNIDFDEGHAFIFFVIIITYGFFLINSIYSLTSTWKFSTFFPKLMVIFYKAKSVGDERSLHIIKTLKERNYYAVESFLENPKRPVFLKDVFILLFSFMFSLMIFLVFGIPSIILVSETYQENILSQYVIGNYQNTQTIYPENFLVLPQDPSGTFIVVSILCFVVCLLSLTGLVIHYISNFCCEICVKDFNCRKKFFKFRKWLNTIILSRSYLNFINVMANNVRHSHDKKHTHTNEYDNVITDSEHEKKQKYVIEDLEEQTELKESVFCFVYGNLVTIIFFTASIQFSTIYFSSFTLLRMWAILGIIIQICASFSGLLCILYIFRLLSNTDTIRRLSNLKSENRKRLNEKNKIIGMFIGYGLLIFSIFCVNSISFVFFLVPFELGTYQSDYSASLTKYLVSFSTFLGIIMVTHIMWISQWRSRPYSISLMAEIFKKSN